MDPNNKGLADSQEGEFILNESGTSVSIDEVENDGERASEDKEKAESGIENNLKSATGTSEKL